MVPPILRVLGGEPVWPPPTWLMRQAGRYLPEYRAVRAKAGSFLDLCFTPELAAEVTLQPVRRFGMDAAILFADILLIPFALGQGLRYVEGEGPLLPPLRDAAGVDALRYDPDRLAPVSETVRRVRAALPEEVALIGFAGAPFTVACYMVEGGGSRDFAQVRGLAYRDPAVFDRLIAMIEQATIQYLCAQAEAGAQVLMLFDTWAGILPPGLFARHVTAATARVTAAVRARYPKIPLIGFPRLAGLSLADYTARSGVDAVGLDTSVDLAVAKAVIPERVAMQGNLDPLALVAGGDVLDRSADAILAAMRGRRFIFNLGHGIVPETPPGHVASLIARVRAAS